MKRIISLIAMLILISTAFGEWKVDEDFEGGAIPETWTIINGDDGSTWSAYENADYANNGSWMAFSDSYDIGQDNWLILPQTTIEAGDEVSMYIRSWYSTEEFEILVSVDDNVINDFDDELTAVDDQGDEYTVYNFDLSEYAGQDIYVGIHWICDSYSLLVDDVKLGQAGGGNTAPVINLPAELCFNVNEILFVDFSEFVYDAEGDDLTLSVSDNDEVEVTIEGMIVEFTAQDNWIGVDVMTFYVSDGELEDSDYLQVLVFEGGINHAPEIDLPDEISFMENDMVCVDFSEYVWDIDDDDLSLCVSSNDQVNVEIMGLIVEFSAEPNWYGEDVMMFLVSDGESSGSDFLTVVVYEGGGGINHAPEIELPEEFSFDENSSLTVDFSEYVCDVDMDDLSLSVSGNDQVNVEIMELNVVFTAEADWFGEDEMIFEVSDGELSDSDFLTVVVYEGGINHAPEIELPAIIIFQKNTTYTMDFSEYVSDPEGDELSLTVSDNENVFAAITGLEVEFSALTDWSGIETLSFTVSDGEYENSDDIIVIVTSPDHRYGDVDDNTLVESYDASLLLQYVVGLDPAPAAPLPWEDWRITIADVDGNGTPSAYDAALILQYVVGIITEFPVESGNRNTPNAQVSAQITDNVISYTAMGELYSFSLELPYDYTILDINEEAIYSINPASGKLAMAAAVSMNNEFLRITVNSDQLIDRQNISQAEVNGVAVILTVSGNDSSSETPSVTALKGNYPNPFNPSTEIRFSIAQGETGRLSIFNVRGEKVMSCDFTAGEYNYNWNAESCASGIYYYRLDTQGRHYVHKMTLLK